MGNCPSFNLPAVKPPEGEESVVVVVVVAVDQDRVRAVDSEVPMMATSVMWDPYRFPVLRVAIITIMLLRTPLGSFGTKSKAACAAR